MSGHGNVRHATSKIQAVGTSEPEAWRSFVCGRCGENTSGAVLVRTQGVAPEILWVRCTGCGGGSVVTGAEIVPGAKFGPAIEGLPSAVDEAYDEARRCMSVDAFTGAELVCRKILMHVAVDRAGVKQGASFASYIDALEAHGFITPPMKDWVSLIKNNANEATHELPTPSRRRAEGTVWFTSQLLRIVYEMAHLSQQFAAPDSSEADESGAEVGVEGETV